MGTSSSMSFHRSSLRESGARWQVTGDNALIGADNRGDPSMNYVLFGVLFALGSSVSAETLEWDWDGDEARISEFRLYKDGVQHYSIADPTARSADSAPMEMVGGASYTLRACNPAACSDDSNELWIPKAPGTVRLVITFESE